MKRLEASFKKLLRYHDFAFLEEHGGAIYGVWNDFRLAYLNPAWFRFAKENQGEPNISIKWGLGRSILDCIQGDIKALYQEKLHTCLDSNKVWAHDYECSSDAFYRYYHQIVYPLPLREGLLIVNSLIVEKPHNPKQRQAKSADETIYLDENGFICQCAYCRRVKNFRHHEQWDWVPEWVQHCPDNTSHTYCPACFGHYFTTAASDKPDSKP